MTKLHDPDLPPGEIVEKREDGIWVRNDGVELSPAEKNPYYILATVFGEDDRGFDQKLDDLNAEIWNSWAYSELDKKINAEAAKEAKRNWQKWFRADQKAALIPFWYRPLTDEQRERIREVLADRWVDDPVIPVPGTLDFSNTYFEKDFIWKRGFPGRAVFSNTYFARSAFFKDVKILGATYFTNAHFAGEAGFKRVELAENPSSFRSSGSHVSFQQTYFGGPAKFFGVRIQRSTSFRKARFLNEADFSGSVFSREVEFDDTEFLGRTHFAETRFEKHVPTFFQNRMHDNTAFSARPSYWPKATRANATANKNAYRRLRQISAAHHNPENEHFFLRQEMACDALLKEDWLGRFIVRAFGLVSRYGYSVARPGLVLILLWLGPAIHYLTVFKPDFWATLLAPTSNAAHGDALGRAAGFSFSNLFSFFGLGRRHFGDVWSTAPDMVHFIGGVQSVLGYVFLFFLGLGLRNRFRLR